MSKLDGRTNTGVSALAAIEAARNERRTLAEGALAGERRASIARIFLVSIFLLTVEVIPRLVERVTGLDPLRAIVAIGYVIFTIAIFVHLRGTRHTLEGSRFRPLGVTTIDFGFITVMALTDAHIHEGFEPEVFAMAAAAVISFSVARLSVTDVVYAVACAAVTFVIVSLRAGSTTLDALLFVTGSFSVVGVMIGLTSVAVRTMFQGLRRRDGLTRFLPAPVVERVLAGGPEALAPVQREVTVLFSDIRGFTSLSEHLAPRDVMALLDDYFGRMSVVVKGHDGVVGKFIGDGMLAFWGAPDEAADHAQRAVRAARDMLRSVAELNVERERTGEAHLKIGIGIHTGMVAAGLMGGASQAEYTIIGDAVNVASRVEGLTKEHGVAVLLSETTWARLGDGFPGRRVAEVSIRGRSRTVVVYTIDGV